MIIINKSVATFEGTAKEVTLEFTHCILGFKSVLMKEFGLSEEAVYQIIGKCGEIAFMSNDDRQKYLDLLLNGTEQ